MTTARDLAPIHNVNLPGRGRRRIAFGIGVSLLFHALLLLVVLENPPEREGEPTLSEPGPITLLLPPMPVPQAPVTPPTPIPQAAPAKPSAEVKPPRRSAPRPKPRIVKPDPRPEPAPETTVATVAPPTSPAPPEPEMDMTAMIEAARQRRRAASATTVPAETASADNDIAAANIEHSLRSQSRRRDGTSGIFQIVNKGVRSAQFSFHGWTPGSSRQINQLFEVDAGFQGDIDRAIVRKMIELIRKHYPGDFNWDSRRLGRIVVLSARPGDNAALESFLLREFFNGNG